MSKLKRTVEFYINGRLFATCSFNKLDEFHSRIKSLFKEKGYYYVWSDDFTRNPKLSSANSYYANPFTYKCLTFAYKIWTGFKDKNGNKLYEQDTVKTPEGYESWLSKSYTLAPYYVREPKQFGNWSDHDVFPEQMSSLEKVKDAILLPTEYWKKAATIKESEF